jgi:hypothetical protein
MQPGFWSRRINSVSKIHPYSNAPPERIWRTAVASPPPGDVDPVVRMKWRISETDRVATAGSCFAQHISKRLRTEGFAFLNTEPAHPLVPPETAQAHHYGLYSARYGNIYTARQLLQLFRRAYGAFQPADDVWETNGRFFDPFRPLIQPGGFASRQEYELDRRQHFAAVRSMFEQMDVFIFTLGLTECWESRVDGAVYSVCPGTAAGEFDANRHAFRNLGVEDVVDDMTAFFTELATVNPRARTILTVSPVPLVATAEDRHVLVSTTYSKSVLRVAADILARREDVAYFPSYEIITGPFSRGAYFADDLRQVTEAGVEHVMRLFLSHATTNPNPARAAPEQITDTFVAASAAAVAALCDEEQLDAAAIRPAPGSTGKT